MSWSIMSIHDLLIKPNFRDIAQTFVNNDNRKRILAIFNTISLSNGNLILSPLHFRSDRRPCWLALLHGVLLSRWKCRPLPSTYSMQFVGFLSRSELITFSRVLRLSRFFSIFKKVASLLEALLINSSSVYVMFCYCMLCCVILCCIKPTLC